MKFKIDIKTGNVALTEDNYEYHLAELIREVADKVENGHKDGVILDYCGGTVGSWQLKD